MDIIVQLLSRIEEIDYLYWLVILSLIATYLIGRLIHSLLKGTIDDKNTRLLIKRFLRADSAHRYRGMLDKLLDGFSNYLGTREARVRGLVEVEDDIIKENKAAWSWGLLDFTLFIALVYPAFGLCFYWMLTGHDGAFGKLVVFPNSDNFGYRAAVVTSITACFFIGIATRIMLADEDSNTWRLRITSALAWGGLFGIAFYAAGSGLLAVVSVGVAAAACSLLFRGTGAVPGSGTTIALASSGIGLALAGYAPFPGVGEATVLMGTIFAIVIGVSLDHLRIWLEVRFGYKTATLLTFIIFFYFISLLAAANQAPVGNVTDDEILSTILFFGMLPIANAIADWISIGCTRFLLSSERKFNPIIYSIADAVLAAMSFFLLGFITISTVYLIESVSGRILINIPVVLGNGPDSIERSPLNYSWIMFIFLSTLIPTIIHGAIAAFSIVMFWPKFVKKIFISALEHKSKFVRNSTEFGLSYFAALIIVLFFWIFFLRVGVFSFFNSSVLQVMLDVFRWFAHTIGAI